MVRARYVANPGAITALGARIMVGRDAPCSPVDGLELLNEAARQNDADAWCHLAVMAAAGVGRVQSWQDAFSALDRAVRLAHVPALRQRHLLTAVGIACADDVDGWLSRVETRVLRDQPRVAALANFLPPALCDYLIDRSRPRLKRAQVFDARAGGLKFDPMRTNSSAAYSVIDTDVVMQLVRARMARATGVAFDTLEPVEVLHYSGGETYRPHVDFFHPSLPNYADEMRVRGQRIRTCLVYLNDGYDGGETAFPKLGMRFRGAVGEALVFDNVLGDGTGDMDTLHTGLPPTSGEKWLLSQWIREKPQPIA